VPLSAGERVGPYEILGPLGRGGMGEVYRARDPRLQRDVALKVIRDEGASDPQSLARFEREARAVAALHHPGILAIYDTGLQGGAPYAVMELLSGETLAERLQAGPLPEREASEIAARVADALAVAHAHDIVHRDVKPSNVFLTEDGQTKLLDFGIARVRHPAAGTKTSAPTSSLTAGHLVGTAGYVSPEQVRGKDADARSDVFALGATLFEALTGHRAFPGSTPAETLSAILTADPAEYPDTARVSAGLRRILLRALEKDPANRYQSARDLALDLRAFETGALAASVPPSAPRPSGPSRAAAVAVGAVLLGAGAFLGSRFLSRDTASPAGPVTRALLSLTPPLSATTAERPLFAISGDGERLVYVGEVEGRSRLVLREMDGLETRVLPGTEDATGPFFSPDGSSVGFVVGGELKKVSLAGGAPISLGTLPPVSRGASWGPDGNIVLSPANTHGLVRGSASTGEQRRLAWPDYDHGELAYFWPEVLPGGKAVLFVVNRGGDGFETASIAALRLDTGEKKVLLTGGTSPHYSPTGHLVYARGGAVLAAPFDPEKLEVTGPAVPLLSGVRTEGTGAAQMAFSGNGTLVYLHGRSPNRALYRLVRVDRSGRSLPLVSEVDDYYGPRFSPDGKRLAFAKGEVNQDVWVADLERGTVTRLTPEDSEEFDPVWSSDGKQIAYASDRRSLEPRVFGRPSDGSGEEKVLGKRETALIPQSWSSDGKTLVLSEVLPATGWNIWTLEPERGDGPRPFLVTPDTEAQPDLSPDGRWITYTSDESGRLEVYARPFPGPGGKLQISADGGTEPVWSRDGRELFYRNGDRMMSVTVRLGQELHAGRPAVLFTAAGFLALPFVEFRQYDAAPDGKSFVMIQLPDAQAVAVPILVTNWFSELVGKAASPARR
jgi:eukaryotic-like serine/threonine-protein kinase